MAKKQTLFLWIFPVVVLLAQLVPPAAALLGGVAFFLAALCAPKWRALLLLFSLAALGHGLWATFAAWLATQPLPLYGHDILGRFGLVGYLVLFALWRRLAPPAEDFLHWGQARATLRLPLLWKGRPEPIWRFILLFCGICLVPLLFFVVTGRASGEVLAAGVLFTLVNATLEEILWRGLILPRTLNFASGPIALTVTSVAFGLYHISLGYPPLFCLVFAVGGMYIGGSALFSKGLLAPWLMHVMVNLVMVAAGMLF